MIDAFFRWLAEWYLPDPGLAGGRIQGLTWTLIDLVIVGSLLRVSHLARGRAPLVRWALLALTGAAAPLILAVRTDAGFFMLESAICGVQFLILLWTGWADRRPIVDLVMRRLRDTHH